MKITFLGTGTSQGVPLIGCDCNVCTSADPRDHRLRASVLIQANNTNIVIDAGPDFRQQMLRCGIRHLDALLITHPHKDHIGGMDDAKAFNYLMKKPVDVFAGNNVLEIIRRDFSYAFDEERYPGVPDYCLHPIGSDPFLIGSTQVIPFEVTHYKLPVTGFRIGDFAYITDANNIPDQTRDSLKNVKTLVINALRHRPHISHFSLSEALEEIERIQPEKACLTHISHQMGSHEETSRILPKNVIFAFDGLTLEI